MTAKFSYHGISMAFRILLNGMTDISQMFSGFDCFNPKPHRFIGHLAQSLALDTGFADEVHAAGIAVISVLDNGNIDVDDITGFEPFVSRHTVTNLVVDGCANGFRVRRIAGRGIIERRGNGILHVHHVIVAQLVELIRCDSWLDKRCNVIQHFRCKSARYPHFLYFVRGFEMHRHTNSKAMSR